MENREKIVKVFADYEPYAHALPCVTIKSRVYMNVLELLKEQQTEIEDLRTAMQSMIEGQCIIAGNNLTKGEEVMKRV